MLADSTAFSGFAVDDMARRRGEFYEQTLGVARHRRGQRGLAHAPPRGRRPPDADLSEAGLRARATYTILNFRVADIDEAVDALIERGVDFERYEGFPQDEKGISHGRRPDIASIERSGRQHPLDPPRPNGRRAAAFAWCGQPQHEREAAGDHADRGSPSRLRDAGRPPGGGNLTPMG